MNTYSYFTDGAATMINKNGEYIRQEGGWAFIVLVNGEREGSQSGGCKLTTNNEMELYAIYASMRHFKDNANAGDKLEIYSDSGYCIGIFTQWAVNWEKNGWTRRGNKPIENLELIRAIWDSMNEIKKGSDIEFIKVKGHSNNALNNEVDRLAVNAKKDSAETGKTVGYNNRIDSLLGKK
ncbi:MAG: ribonuclease HI [Methanobrevibacter sp.]|uniref:ribonuclease H family protein n=1 Tax=Methanobrevibacter sp. TaxID=66852 RepID=UPI001B48E877|nr:ribonuclease H [Methanobrevibacter sp.]MBP3792401.1 ribonuclease HI [Methanobrevibacter sp.]